MFEFAQMTTGDARRFSLVFRSPDTNPRLTLQKGDGDNDANTAVSLAVDGRLSLQESMIMAGVLGSADHEFLPVAASRGSKRRMLRWTMRSFEGWISQLDVQGYQVSSVLVLVLVLLCTTHRIV